MDLNPLIVFATDHSVVVPVLIILHVATLAVGLFFTLCTVYCLIVVFSGSCLAL